MRNVGLQWPGALLRTAFDVLVRQLGPDNDACCGCTILLRRLSLWTCLGDTPWTRSIPTPFVAKIRGLGMTECDTCPRW